MGADHVGDRTDLLSALANWCLLWDVPDLDSRLQIVWSSRFRRSLGRFSAGSSQVRLAAFLLEGHEILVKEVLCHEAAHAAVFELHGRTRAPHGPEWRRLMEVAGYEPRARFPEHLLPSSTRRLRGLWEHRCPVCHAYRIARTPAGRWRCRACNEAGLPGALTVRALAPRGVSL